ncbi:CpsD/CapB family tyrosine-protein kinase [Anaerococcus rubeinfantis]|uniref:CpsD/CapB family tyrosine-protein kinase n=1 Tax=Anaerococcus rubeinfantis TaxID=1720199 RepID=UPI00073E185F|nr:CpsD/CapB family tyrosine-protein kinase [Anaerococcus rubeinfantis]
MKEKNGYLSNSSFYDESIYSIKTNLKYNNEYKNYKIIGMTSSKPNEKNTKALYDIAKSFASDGLKVALLDFDLRMPKLDKLLKLDKNIGLTNFFYEDNNINEILIKDKNQENLSILLSGQKPNNPTEILDSSKVKDLIKDLSKEFDYIFINIPPVDLLADGSIISTYCDGMILSFKYNDTRKEELEKAIINLKKVNANIIGLIMTHADINKNIYKGYFNK